MSDTRNNGPVRVQKAGEIVANRLRNRIIRGELPAGDSLPTEGELTAEFQISRPTLREALRVLESESLINVKRGIRNGPMVQAPSEEVAAKHVGMVLQYQQVTLADVYAARNIIEVPAAGMAAERSDPDVIAKLERNLAEIDQLPDKSPPETTALMTEFHRLVVLGSGNATVHLLSTVIDHIIEMATRSHLDRAGDDPAVVEASRAAVREHARFVELLKKGSVRAAQDHWRRHLFAAAQHLLQDDSITTVLDVLADPPR